MQASASVEAGLNDGETSARRDEIMHLLSGYMSEVVSESVGYTRNLS
jgi:hypothetical protein